MSNLNLELMSCLVLNSKMKESCSKQQMVNNKTEETFLRSAWLSQVLCQVLWKGRLELQDYKTEKMNQYQIWTNELWLLPQI